MDFSDIEAMLFDLDGVLTPTAQMHEEAWKRTFVDFLCHRAHNGFEPFTRDEYLTYVDGKPRYDGVASFLESRGVSLPHGEPSDTPGYDTITAVGNAKNQTFSQVLESDGVEPYADAVLLLDHVSTLPLRLAVVSSSANARPVLRASGLLDRFEFVMDGIVARTRSLAGKPQPDTFIAAAAEVGASPAGSVVFEDAVSGVQAGAAGGFHTVVGVDRTNSAAALRDAGADIVVEWLTDVLE